MSRLLRVGDEMVTGGVQARVTLQEPPEVGGTFTVAPGQIVVGSQRIAGVPLECTARYGSIVEAMPANFPYVLWSDGRVVVVANRLGDPKSWKVVGKKAGYKTLAEAERSRDRSRAQRRRNR